MCRPSLIQVATEPPPYLCGNPEASEPYSPATVEDRKDIGIVMKYWIRFDDGQVSTQQLTDSCPLCSEYDFFDWQVGYGDLPYYMRNILHILGHHNF